MINYLETLKIKPNIKKHTLVDIIIPEPPSIINQPGTIQPPQSIVMIDDRKKDLIWIYLKTNWCHKSY